MRAALTSTIAFLIGFILFAPSGCVSASEPYYSKCWALLFIAVPGDGTSVVSWLPALAAGGFLAAATYGFLFGGLSHRHPLLAVVWLFFLFVLGGLVTLAVYMLSGWILAAAVLTMFIVVFRFLSKQIGSALPEGSRRSGGEGLRNR